jgi:hypothetical protein
LLTKEQLAAFGTTPKVIAVEVPGLPEPVYLRVMSGKARGNIEHHISRFESKGEQPPDLRGWILCATLCDKDGRLLFPDTMESVNAILEWSTTLLDTLIVEAMKLNRINLGSMEELRKNSEAGQSDDSG